MVTAFDFIAAAAAIDRIGDGAAVAILGCGGGSGEPEALVEALGRRFRETGSPRDLTLIHAAGLGDRDHRGLAPIAEPGLIKRVIGGHWGQTPAMSRLAEREEIEAYNIPLGVMFQLHREIGGRRPGLLTKTGLGTFADPRIEGGRMNARTTEDLVEVVEVDGEEYLFYKAYPIDFALIKARTADSRGNLSLYGEPAFLDTLGLALAARAGGGEVIAQVKHVLEPGERIDPTRVKVPGVAVDAVVVAPCQQQTYESEDDPAYAGIALRDLVERPMALSARKVIARRAARFLSPGAVVAVGVGMPDGIGAVLGEEGVEDMVTFTMETGLVGGVAAPGVLFGAGSNFEAMLDGADVIDFYNGGGLDFAALGFAQVDRHGNANVSKYNGIVMGSGGFVDISQSARHVILCGTLTAAGLRESVADGRLTIETEGEMPKLIEAVDQITFSGPQSKREGKRLNVVTERAVFELREAGLTVIEIAPGLDLEHDVIAQMGFRPEVASDLVEMDQRLFRPEPIGIFGSAARQ